MVESGKGKIYFKQLAINYCNKTNQKLNKIIKL